MVASWGFLLLVLLLAKSHQASNGHSNKHRDLEIPFRSLVAVRTVDGDIAWVEARYINETHGRHFKHQGNPFTGVERVSILLPVFTFLFPFLIWMFCMVLCLHRSHQRHVYY